MPRILFILICIYTFSLPFELFFEVEFGLITIFKPYRILSIIIVVLSVLQMMAKGKTIDSIYVKKPNVILIFLVLFLICLTVLRISLLGGSWSFFLNDIMQTLYLFFVFLVIHSLQWNRKQIETMFWVLVAALMLNGILMLSQYFGDSILSRSKGYLSNPNAAGFSYNVVLLYLYYQLTNRRLNLLKKFAIIGVIFYFYVLIFTTGSRTGMGLVAAGLVYLLYLLSTATKVKLFASIFVFLLIVINPVSNWIANNYRHHNLLVRISTFDSEKDIRRLIWSGGWNAAKSSMFTGVGVAQFRYDFGRHFEGMKHARHLAIRKFDGLGLHNDYMNLLVEGGVITLLLYISFMLWNVIDRFKLRRYKLPSLQLFILVFLLVYGMVAINFITPVFWYFLSFASLKY